MEIKYCDEYNTAIVELDKRELGIITGIKFEDIYGNAERNFSEALIGKKFDIRSIEKTMRTIHIAHELKARTATSLREMAERIESTVNFSLPETGEEND